jgi:hypothetical protein
MRSLILALCVPACVAAQQDSTYSPELLTAVRLGSHPAAVSQELKARGFSVRGTRPTLSGEQVVFAGTLDNRPAEIIAWFGSPSRGPRLINYTVNFPVKSEAELHATYAWLYRRVVTARCEAELQPDYRAQLDSVLAQRAIGIPPAAQTSMAGPVLPGGTAIQQGNIDWPEPAWLSPDGAYGSRLIASRLPQGAAAPFQVSLWSTVLFGVAGNPTTCADTRAHRLAERAAQPGHANTVDTLQVAVLPGASGRVDTLRIPPAPEGSEPREFILTYARGARIEYHFTADSGYEKLMVVTGDGGASASGSLVLQGSTVLAAAAQPALRPENRKLYELFRQQLSASDPVAVYVEIQCEIERLMKEYPERASTLIEQAQGLAIDPERDRKALIRIDKALAGRVFGGCQADRRRKP